MKRLIFSVIAVVMCITCFAFVTAEARDFSREEMYAGQLKDLGIFKGVSDTEFDLERAPTRVEAIVMLIRILGKEDEALGGSWRHPFTDVPSWADKYVGYAYAKGISNGVETTLFGTGNATSQMYITFMLRALGYSDAGNEDFVWTNPYPLAQRVGILPEGMDEENFLRADAVLVSHASLNANFKDTHTPLNRKLIEAGVFTQKTFVLTYTVIDNMASSKKVLTSEQIYKLCSPAVFTIVTYDSKGEGIALGSGFFIDDNGTAITNYHVIDKAYYAEAYIEETEEVFDITGVYACSEDADWAVIKVDTKGNDFLEVGDKATVTGGSVIYALGSPEGYTNTLTEGIISNPARQNGDYVNIQISAPITHGNSGGALINQYGEVIGINTWGHGDGSLGLNFAVPVYYALNYDRNTVHSFAEVVLAMYGTPKEEEKSDSTVTMTDNAFDALCAYVFENGYEEDGVYYYEDYLEANGTTVYFTLLANDEDEFGMMASLRSDTSECLYAFVLEKGGNEAGVFLEMYEVDEYGVTAEECMIEAEGYFDISSFDGAAPIIFDSVIPDDQEIAEGVGTLATSFHTVCLNYLDYVFEGEMGTDYTCYDLGFISCYDESEIEEDTTADANLNNPIKEYIVENGEYDRDLDQYSMIDFYEDDEGETHYICLNYNVEEDIVKLVYSTPNDSMYIFGFTDDASEGYTYIASVNVEDSTLFSFGSVYPGISLMDNAEKAVSVDYCDIDAEEITDNEGAISLVKENVGIGCLLATVLADSVLLDGSGISIMDFYSLVM